MAARYISSTAKLYRNVFLAVIMLLTGIFAYVYFFMVESVTISFNTGNSGIVVESIKIEQGKSLGEDNFNLIMNLDSVKERGGYIFNGWFYNGDPLQADTVFNRNAVIFAAWNPLKYEVEFNLNGGSYNTNLLSLSDYEGVKDFGTSFNMPPNDNNVFYQGNLSTDGKVLNNWLIQKTGKTVNASESFTLNSIADINLFDPMPSQEEPQGKITFSAQWKKQTVKVSFMRGVEDLWVEEEFDKGTIIPTSQIPNTSNLSGWTGSWNDGENNIEYKYLEFEGWYTSLTYTTKVNLTTHYFNQNTTLYAKFAPKPYIVSFELAGGVGAHIVPQQVRFNEFVLEPEPPTKEGYTFTGWWYGVQPGLNPGEWIYDPIAKAFNFSKTLQGNFTSLAGTTTPKLYAKWEEEVPPQNTPIMFFTFENAINSDGSIIPNEKRLTSITDRNNDFIDIVVPAKDRFGVSVTQIGPSAFADAINVKKITILSNITYIHPDAFNSVQSGRKTLNDIKVLSTNPNYKDIDGVLYSKDGTVLIKYPPAREDKTYLVGKDGYNVTEINDSAFYQSDNLETITLNVRKVGNYAFQYSEKLKTIILTDKVQEIGNYAFADCANLETITIESGNQHFVTDGKALYSYGYKKLLFYKSTNINTQYEINAQTTEIISGAFKNVHNLEKIFMFNVEKIESQAFTSLGALETIDFGSSLTEIGERAFYLCSNLKHVTLPNTITTYPDPSSYRFIFYSCEKLQTINIYGSSAASVAYFGQPEIENYLITNGITLITL